MTIHAVRFLLFAATTALLLEASDLSSRPRPRTKLHAEDFDFTGRDHGHKTAQAMRRAARPAEKGMFRASSLPGYRSLLSPRAS